MDTRPSHQTPADILDPPAILPGAPCYLPTNGGDSFKSLQDNQGRRQKVEKILTQTRCWWPFLAVQFREDLKGSLSLYLRTSYQGAPKNNPEGHFRPCQCWRSIWFQIWNKEIGGVSEGPGSQVKVLDEKCQLEMSAMRRTEWEIVFPCRVWRESNGGEEGFERKCCEVTMALCGITVQINEAAMISE